MKNTTKIACLIGFVVGTTTALLFASKKGEELRAQIAKERMRGGFGTTAMKKAWITMVHNALGLAKENMPTEDFVEDVKENGRAKMNDLVQKARKVIEQEAETVKNSVQFQVQKMSKRISPKRNKKQR